jgi:hypothetical protein
MKRWAVRICVLLLLGAIVNVAVAWGCSVLGPVNHMVARREATEAELRWLEELGWRSPEQAGDRGAWRYEVFAQGVRYTGATYIWFDQFGRRQASQEVTYYGHVPLAILALQVEAGWPTTSLYGVTLDKSALGQPSFHTGVEYLSGLSYIDEAKSIGCLRSSLFDRLPTSTGRFVPLLPIFPGFAINTVFYATILWLLFFAPFTLRRWRRIRRGLCVKCAYDLRGRPPAPGDDSSSTVCPECGAALNQKAETPKAEITP